jgi:hypothetical protein
MGRLDTALGRRSLVPLLMFGYLAEACQHAIQGIGGGNTW